MSIRTEPIATPSHTAVVESTREGNVLHFSVFCKDGTWYYDRAISLVSQGERIRPEYFHIAEEYSAKESLHFRFER